MYIFVGCQDTVGNSVLLLDNVVQCPTPAQAGHQFILNTLQFNSLIQRVYYA